MWLLVKQAEIKCRMKNMPFNSQWLAEPARWGDLPKQGEIHVIQMVRTLVHPSHSLSREHSQLSYAVQHTFGSCTIYVHTCTRVSTYNVAGAVFVSMEYSTYN